MLVTLAVFAVALTAAVANPTSLIRRQAVDVHCGTTDDATLSDCQELVQEGTWNAAWAGGNNVCHYTNIIYNKINYPAFNVACHGNCCVYYAHGGPNDAPGTVADSTSIRNRAAGLLGCGDTGSNKVNALGVLSTDRSGVCISNGNGCGDCFDDSDFI